MVHNNQITKIILYPILYWIIFIIFPFIIVYNIKDYNRVLNIPGIIMFYILFIAPLLYVIPYKLVQITSKQKLIFVFVGLIIPYLVLYVYVVFQVMRSLNNSHFPF